MTKQLDSDNCGERDPIGVVRRRRSGVAWIARFAAVALVCAMLAVPLAPALATGELRGLPTSPAQSVISCQELWHLARPVVGAELADSRLERCGDPTPRVLLLNSYAEDVPAYLFGETIALPRGDGVFLDEPSFLPDRNEPWLPEDASSALCGDGGPFACFTMSDPGYLPGETIDTVVVVASDVIVLSPVMTSGTNLIIVADQYLSSARMVRTTTDQRIPGELSTDQQAAGGDHGRRAGDFVLFATEMDYSAVDAAGWTGLDGAAATVGATGELRLPYYHGVGHYELLYEAEQAAEQFRKDAVCGVGPLSYLQNSVGRRAQLGGAGGDGGDGGDIIIRYATLASLTLTDEDCIERECDAACQRDPSVSVCGAFREADNGACVDGQDNDSDGLVDCFDPDCYENPNVCACDNFGAACEPFYIPIGVETPTFVPYYDDPLLCTSAYLNCSDSQTSAVYLQNNGGDPGQGGSGASLLYDDVTLTASVGFEDGRSVAMLGHITCYTGCPPGVEGNDCNASAVRGLDGSRGEDGAKNALPWPAARTAALRTVWGPGQWTFNNAQANALFKRARAETRQAAFSKYTIDIMRAWAVLGEVGAHCGMLANTGNERPDYDLLLSAICPSLARNYTQLAYLTSGLDFYGNTWWGMLDPSLDFPKLLARFDYQYETFLQHRSDWLALGTQRLVDRWSNIFAGELQERLAGEENELDALLLDRAATDASALALGEALSKRESDMQRLNEEVEDLDEQIHQSVGSNSLGDIVLAAGKAVARAYLGAMADECLSYLGDAAMDPELSPGMVAMVEYGRSVVEKIGDRVGDRAKDWVSDAASDTGHASRNPAEFGALLSDWHESVASDDGFKKVLKQQGKTAGAAFFEALKEELGFTNHTSSAGLSHFGVEPGMVALLKEGERAQIAREYADQLIEYNKAKADAAVIGIRAMAQALRVGALRAADQQVQLMGFGSGESPQQLNIAERILLERAEYESMSRYLDDATQTYLELLRHAEYELLPYDDQGNNELNAFRTLGYDFNLLNYAGTADAPGLADRVATLAEMYNYQPAPDQLFFVSATVAPEQLVYYSYDDLFSADASSDFLPGYLANLGVDLDVTSGYYIGRISVRNNDEPDNPENTSVGIPTYTQRRRLYDLRVNFVTADNGTGNQGSANVRIAIVRSSFDGFVVALDPTDGRPLWKEFEWRDSHWHYVINEGACADLPLFLEYPFETVCGIPTTAGAQHRLVERSVIGDWYVVVPQETFESQLEPLVQMEVVFQYTARQP